MSYACLLLAQPQCAPEEVNDLEACSYAWHAKPFARHTSPLSPLTSGARVSSSIGTLLPVRLGQVPVRLVLCVDHVNVRVLSELRGWPACSLRLRGQLRQIGLALNFGNQRRRLLDGAEGVVIQLHASQRIACTMGILRDHLLSTADCLVAGPWHRSPLQLWGQLRHVMSAKLRP